MLRCADVELGTHPSGDNFMQIRIPRTKTHRSGYTISVGCSGTPVCAYCSVRHYLKSRRIAFSCLLHDPLFVFENGQILTKAMLNAKIKQVTFALGLSPDHFTSHSLRAGVASSAAELGFQDWEIKMLGNWTSDCYRRYIRHVDAHVLGFAQRLACPRHGPK